jgi:hypothetical protein
MLQWRMVPAQALSYCPTWWNSWKPSFCL